MNWLAPPTGILVGAEKAVAALVMLWGIYLMLVPGMPREAGILRMCPPNALF